jgi:cell division septation protein DedD
VRRLPSSNVGRPGAPATGVLGETPPDEKLKRNPLYVALAIAGVLILGAGAAIGVPKLVNGAKSNNSPTKAATKTKKKASTIKKAAPVSPAKITVAVLNGTGIPGLAAQIGDRVDADGFTLGTVSNASQAGGQRANSVAMYAAGHQRDAQAVAKKLRIKTVTQVDAASQSIAGDASVVVVVGSDKTQ